MVPGDRLDNDCDGLIDEDTCYDNIDNDRDGRMVRFRLRLHVFVAGVYLTLVSTSDCNLWAAVI
jgi:hypothetical protein